MKNFVNKVVRVLGLAERKTQDKKLRNSLTGIAENFDKTGTLPVNVRIECIPTTKGALNAMVVVRGITPIHYRHEINGNPEWVPVYEDTYIQVFRMREFGPANWTWHYTRLREEPSA